MTEPTNSELANKLESMAKRRDENDEHQILGWVSDVYRLAAQRLRQAEADAEDAARWRLASTSRNFGITNWCEFGQRTIYDKSAEAIIDAAIDAARKEQT